MSFKASKYTIWMNYDNDKKQYQVPMNPESIQIKIDGKAVTSDIDRGTTAYTSATAKILSATRRKRQLRSLKIAASELV